MCQAIYSDVSTDRYPWQAQQPADILLECYSSVSVGEQMLYVCIWMKSIIINNLSWEEGRIHLLST